MWKLFYMWEHPSHFPLAVWTALTDWGDRLWPELIGILGWQDIWLRPSTYLVVTILLILVPFEKLKVDGATRARVLLISGLTVLGYVVVVYLIFFLTYTRWGTATRSHHAQEPVENQEAPQAAHAANGGATIVSFRCLAASG